MNRKQYITTLIVFAVVAVLLIVANAVLSSLEIFTLDWIWIFVIISVGYMYLRYKVTSPLQMFSTKFNMLVDYDLDVEGALNLVKENYENAPTLAIKNLFMIYLGMAHYYKGNYRESINTFNQIDLKKVNRIYHILIFAFTAYSAYEENDTEAFDIAMERLEQVKNQVNRKYFSFVSSYIEILSVMKNLEIAPEAYREVIERNFSKEDGYISTKLVYNYRMALYYKAVGNQEEMDICLAKVIANGKDHHTALQAKRLFQGTVNVEDYVFTDDVEAPVDVDVVEEPKQIETIEEVEVVETKDSVDTLEEVVEEVKVETPSANALGDLTKKSVPELRDLCREYKIAGYYKMKKAELIEALEEALK